MRSLICVCVLLILSQANAYAVSNPGAAVGRVVNMLTNIVNMVETESKSDEEHNSGVLDWCKAEIAATQHVVTGEQTKIEDTNAILSDLGAQKMKLDDVVGSLNTQLTHEQSQLNQATERRNEESNAFTPEMQNFDNAISACGKAVAMLVKHYGDGTPHEAKKPEWMSLLNEQLKTVRAFSHLVTGKDQHRNVAAFMQKNPAFDTYEESTGEGLNIVDQVKELSASFTEDQEASREEEGRMQDLYNDLSAKKTQMINSLTTERDTQTSQLTTMNQGIAENQGTLAMSTDLLKDRQTYLATVQEQQQSQTEAFNLRKADRQAELQAVNQAISVLESKSFLQERAQITTQFKLARLAEVTIHQAGQAALYSNFDQAAARIASRAHRVWQPSLRRSCQNCQKVASLLKAKAKMLHSSVLAMAAATSVGNEALTDVIRSLDNMIDQLAQDQKTEKEHKEWCEQEISLTTGRRNTHQYTVTSIEQNLADVGELISMKQTSVQENAKDIAKENKAFEQLESIRDQQHEEFDEDVQDHQDAILAINEAINVLADFYAKRNQGALSARQGSVLLQLSQPADGSKTVSMMSSVRKEFEDGVTALKKIEAEQLAEFQTVQEKHQMTSSDLLHDKDALTVEVQTAQQQLATNQRDHESHTGEIAASNNYLGQLNRSCGPLLDNYDSRVKLRKEEKQAIEDAIRVLQDA